MVCTGLCLRTFPPIKLRSWLPVALKSPSLCPGFHQNDIFFEKIKCSIPPRNLSHRWFLKLQGCSRRNPPSSCPPHFFFYMVTAFFHKDGSF